jgi:Recombinase
VVWRLPTQSRIHQMLRNPQYAGAFVYGRTQTTTTVTDERTRTTRRRKSPDAWTVFLPDHHDGYVTWDEYRHTQRVLEANVSRRDAPQPGSARRGSALLSGLLRCGRCGRRLLVTYLAYSISVLAAVRQRRTLSTQLASVAYNAYMVGRAVASDRHRAHACRQ